MGSFGCRSGRGRASTSTTSLPALRRHYRVCPQWLVVGSRADPVGVVGGMRGARAPATRAGAAAHLVAALGPPRRLSRRGPEVGDRSELRALGSGTRSFERVSRAESAVTEVTAGSPLRPGAGSLRASSRELRRPGTRGCTDGACLASGRLPKRATAGRRWPKPKAAFARPSGSLTERGRHPGVEARVREGGPRGCLPGGHRPRPAAPRKTRSGTSDDTFPGVRSLSANRARAIVACRFASPTPSVLRVSHPLDGLIPPGPCGFVSPHIRP
jgi:hypothetical protein